MIIGAAAWRPMVLALACGNGQIVDAGDAPLHEPVLVKFPVLITIGAVPIAGVVMPLIGKTHGYPIAMKRPKLLDETIIQLPVPFPGEELNDSLAARHELGTVAPDAVR